MKRSLFFFLTVLFLSSFSTLSAQMEEEQQQPEFKKIETPKWVSDKGYWVVESNKNTPKDAIVYFYNNENVMVYKEEIRNRKLKLNRSKVLLHLKAALEEAIASYEKGTWASNSQIITQHLQQ